MTFSSSLNNKNMDNNNNNNKQNVYRYNICNGLSNQFLYHAASIAKAYQYGNYSIVEVPDYFLYNGIQTTSQDVLPVYGQNAVTFGTVLNAPYFVNQVETILAPLKVQFVTFHHHDQQQATPVPVCAGMNSFINTNPQIIQTILSFFQPSRQMQHILQPISQQLFSSSSSSSNQNIMCLHHRDGQDWHDHCQRWSTINDGIYRGNCLLPKEETLLQAVQYRTRSSTNSWTIYYCGDHDIPMELQNNSNYHVVSREHFLHEQDRQAVLQLALSSSSNNNQTAVVTSNMDVRDLWALVDFFVCAHVNDNDNDNNNNNLMIPFIGNSVSTFSALQIALRHNNHAAYWYNSQSIPLAAFWPVYQIPIVYYITFPDSSTATATTSRQRHQQMQHLYALQTSIASIQAQMPDNDIYIIYHRQRAAAPPQPRPSAATASRSSNNDNSSDTINLMELWILEQQQHVRQQHVMFYALSSSSSSRQEEHLDDDRQKQNSSYSHSWMMLQDIAQIMDTEYCLVLNIHTLVTRPFTLADFGLNVTRTTATTTATTATATAINTQEHSFGPTLVNVPYLRRIQQQQLKQEKVVENNVDVLSASLWTKPHQARSDKQVQETILLDFTQGSTEASDYMRLIMGIVDDKCTLTTMKTFLRRTVGQKSLGYSMEALFCGNIDRKKNRIQQVCHSLQVFANHVPDPMGYCQVTFGSYNNLLYNNIQQQQQQEPFVLFCHEIFQALLSEKNEQCRNFSSLVLDVALPKVIRSFHSTTSLRSSSWRQSQQSLPLRWLVAQRLGVSKSSPFSRFLSSCWFYFRGSNNKNSSNSMRRFYTFSITSWLILTILFIKCHRRRRAQRLDGKQNKSAASIAIWSIPVLLWAIMSFLSLPMAHLELV